MTQWENQPEETQFTAEEQTQFLQLAKKIGWRKTGKDVFEAFFPIFPFVLCELAVLREINGVPHVLLWHRDDEHYKGWHMPGGYILRGESMEEVARRILFKETGLTLQSADFVQYFNSYPGNASVPNHQIALLFLCKTKGEPAQGKFFPYNNIPADTLSHHKAYIKFLQQL